MKKSRIIIGIDVGGTNTDAVLLQGKEILAIHKSVTTADISSGIQTAIKKVLEQSNCKASQVSAVIIGTTHFINAILERQHLVKVAAIRLCLPAASDFPPFSGWPDYLINIIGNKGYLISGGLEYDGSPISAINKAEVLNIADDLIHNHIKNVAITGIFSQIDASMEHEVAEILLSKIPDLNISLSHNIGRLGLIERENATILNASMFPLAKKVVTAFSVSIKSAGIKAPFYLTQNDGTIMNQAYAQKYPILTCAAGCTNSMRGAAFLAQCQNAIVIDIGGTSTDIGVLVDGFPRITASWIELGGVRTNFPIPDTFSVALGGGSIVSQSKSGDITIGPESVGSQILTEALIFGGNRLTTTDIAVANKHIQLGNPKAILHLEDNKIQKILQKISSILSDGIERMKSTDTILPLILVGGGAILISEKQKLFGAAKIIRPRYAEVANAVGAAIAQVSGLYDQIVSYEKISRDHAHETAVAKASALALQNSAQPDTLKVTEVEEISIPNLPGKMTRLRIKVVGDLNVK